MSIPTLDSLSGVIGRDTIGEEENKWFPVTFAFESSFHYFAVDSVHQFVEPAGKGSTSTDRNFRRIESDDILQRRNDLTFPSKANDREPNGFECKWVGFKFFDNRSHTVLHVFYGVAYHRFGDVEEEINGESAHISEK